MCHHLKVVIFLLSFLSSTKAGEECRDYVNITDTSRLPYEYDSERVLCDRNALPFGQWIRFPGISGTVLPETCLPRYGCNTHAPGWLDGQHPNVEDGILDGHVCYHWKNNRTEEDCCLWSSKISIRNCRTFYVYFPSPPPTCYLRLCTVEDHDECLTGAHDCDLVSMDCKNTPGSYFCQCRVGFTGNPPNCTDIDECVNGENLCDLVNGNCSNHPGGYKCWCNAGFSLDGNNCTDVDECFDSQHNCHQDAFCTNNIGSFNCRCNRGFRGDGIWCEACPEYTRYVEVSYGSVTECWCKYFYQEKPELDPCDAMENGRLPMHLLRVNILNNGSQPGTPITFRRDETRTLTGFFTMYNREGAEISYDWYIGNVVLSPLNISSATVLFVHNTLEFYIGREMLPTGKMIVAFELRLSGMDLAARDFEFLQIEDSALVASLAGGTEIIRDIHGPVYLDGSFSYDPETGRGKLTGMEFYWSCFSVAAAESANSSYQEGPAELLDLKPNTTKLGISLPGGNSSSEDTHIELQYLDNTNLSSEGVSKMLRNVNSSEETLADRELSYFTTKAANSAKELLSAFKELDGKTLIQLPDNVFVARKNNGKVLLNPQNLTSNNTYYVALMIRKGNRTASVIQTINIVDEKLPDISIRCVVNCKKEVTTSSRLAFRTDCGGVHCSHSMTYHWTLHVRDSNLSRHRWVYQNNLQSFLSTKINYKNLVVKEQKLIPGRTYRLTVDVKLNGTRGWASYEFTTTEAPTNGMCRGEQLNDKERLAILINISCYGWKDNFVPLTYEFSLKQENESYDILSSGLWSFTTVHVPPPTEGDIVHIKVAIINVFGTASEAHLQIKVQKPVWPNSTVFYSKMVNSSLHFLGDFLFLGEINFAVQEANVLLHFLKMEGERIDSDTLNQVTEHVISRMYRVRTDTLGRLFQIANVLGKATEFATDLSHDSTFRILSKLLDMRSLMSSWVKQFYDTRLIQDAARSLLYCNSNMQRYLTLKGPVNGNLTANDTYTTEEVRNATSLSRNITNLVTNIVLSLKQPGEEYSVIRNDLQSVMLGKQDAHEISQLGVQNENASFLFPFLDNNTMDNIFSNITEVAVQMISYNFNPYPADSNNNRIGSKVISIAVKDENDRELEFKDLPAKIHIDLPLREELTNNSVTESFFNPGQMQRHVINVQNPNVVLKVSIITKLKAFVTLYVRYAEKPTEILFDEAFTLYENDFSPGLDCAGGECLQTVWIAAIYPGDYNLGVLGIRDDTVNHSRIRRSGLSTGFTKEECVRYKDPPPTPPRPTPQTRLIRPQYHPDISVNYSLEVDTVWCGYWSDTENDWSTAGCEVGHGSNSSLVECLCNHLTSFGGDLLVAPNTVDFSKVAVSFKNIEPKDVLVLAVVSSVFLLYCVVLVLARRADKKDLAKDSPLIPINQPMIGGYVYEVSITTGAWKNSGTSANVSMILHGTERVSEVIHFSRESTCQRKLFAQGNTDNFRICLPESLGPLAKIEVGHDSLGDSSAWFLNEILVLDSQTEEQWFFHCYRWLALERDDGNTTRILWCNEDDNSYEFEKRFRALRRNGFADDHLWLSVLRKQPLSSFTRAQRASCCWSLLLLSMVTSAMFYGMENVNTQTIQIGPFKLTASQLIIAVESGLIVLPAGILIVFLFRKSEPDMNSRTREHRHMTSRSKKRFMLPHFCIYIAWFLCISTGVTSAVFTVFYSLMWGGDKSVRWLFSVFVSLVGDMIISQPTKIILVSVIIASRCGCLRRGSSLVKKEKIETLQTASHLSSEQIKNIRKENTNKRKMRTFFKDLIFLLIFFLLLMIVCYGEKSVYRYSMTVSTEGHFKQFEKIQNFGRFWYWMDQVFVPEIFAGNWYNGRKEPITEYIGNKRSLLVGLPRLRQLRIMKDSCTVHSLLRNIWSSCYDDYSYSHEERMQFREAEFNVSTLQCPENWKYSPDKQLGGSYSWGRFAQYSGGGYVANLGYNMATARRVINDLKRNSWIDRQTRAVLLEFLIFNPSTNLIALTTYYYEILPSGFSGTFKRYGTLPMMAADSKTHNTYLFFTLLFGVFLAVSFVKQCIMLFQQKSLYFKSLWNWSEVLQILSATTALVLQWARSKALSTSLKSLSGNIFVPVSFHQALFWSEMENVVICITSVIATLRLLKCFYVNPHVVIMSSTVRRSFQSLTGFCAISSVLSAGYAVLGMIAFGSNVYMFSSFTESVITQYLMLLGSKMPVDELKDVSPVIGRLFVFSFFLTTVILLGNMLVAIINDSYADSCVQKTEEFEVARFILDRILQTLFGYKPKEFSDKKELNSNGVFEDLGYRERERRFQEKSIEFESPIKRGAPRGHQLRHKRSTSDIEKFIAELVKESNFADESPSWKTREEDNKAFLNDQPWNERFSYGDGESVFCEDSLDYVVDKSTCSSLLSFHRENLNSSSKVKMADSEQCNTNSVDTESDLPSACELSKKDQTFLRPWSFTDNKQSFGNIFQMEKNNWEKFFHYLRYDNFDDIFAENISDRLILSICNAAIKED